MWKILICFEPKKEFLKGFCFVLISQSSRLGLKINSDYWRRFLSESLEKNISLSFPSNF